MPDLRELLELLESDDREVRCAAIERSAVAVERLIHAVVASLESAGRHQHYMIEHIHRFGLSMVEPLEALLARARDPDTRILCSLLLLRLHSRAGVAELLQAVRSSRSWGLQAALRLAEAGVHEAEAPIVHRLRGLPLDNEDEIVGLLHSLQTLEGNIPADLVTRFTNPPAPEEAQRIAREAIASA